MRQIRSFDLAFISLLFVALSESCPAATQAGVVVAWGSNSVGQTSFNGSTLARDVAVGGDRVRGGYTAWIEPNGTVLQVGSNIGPVPNGLAGCVEIAGGFRHALARKVDGSVVGWGTTVYGGYAPAYTIPDNLGPCLQIAAGGNNSGALRADGTPISWGGLTSSSPTVGACRQIAVGSGVIAVLKANRLVEILACSNTLFFHNPPVPEPLGTCSAIAAGDFHLLAIRDDGIVVAWGANYSGQCGPASERVGGAGNYNSDSRYGAYWVKSSLGPCRQAVASRNGDWQNESSSGAIRVDGSVTTWGYNGGGQPQTLGACNKLDIAHVHTAAIQVPLPQITGVSPISGPSSGGTAITITGTDFFPYSTVLIGGAPATDVVVVSPTKITAVTPAGFPGPAEVKVNLGSAIAFYYRPECGADLDQNGEVDGADLSIVLLEWGPCNRGVQASGPQNPPELLADEPAQKTGTAKKE